MVNLNRLKSADLAYDIRFMFLHLFVLLSFCCWDMVSQSVSHQIVKEVFIIGWNHNISPVRILDYFSTTNQSCVCYFENHPPNLIILRMDRCKLMVIQYTQKYWLSSPRLLKIKYFIRKLFFLKQARNHVNQCENPPGHWGKFSKNYKFRRGCWFGSILTISW